jgi:hypothetical protein
MYIYTCLAMLESFIDIGILCYSSRHIFFNKHMDKLLQYGYRSIIQTIEP